MSVEPVEDVMREVKRRYDKKRRGWRILAGKDLRGRDDMFISDGSTLWQLKMEQVRPFRYLGYGARVGKVDRDAVDMMRAGRALLFEMISPQRDGSFIVAKGLERYSSKSIGELKGLISDKQRKLEADLARELDRLLFRKYPEKMMYV